jgi:hypothetical protein
MPVILTQKHGCSFFEVLIGDIPARIHAPSNPAFLFNFRAVYLEAVDLENGRWENLIAVTINGRECRGVTTDRRLVGLAMLLAKGKIDAVPLNVPIAFNGMRKPQPDVTRP